MTEQTLYERLCTRPKAEIVPGGMIDVILKESGADEAPEMAVAYKREGMVEDVRDLICMLIAIDQAPPRSFLRQLAGKEISLKRENLGPMGFNRSLRIEIAALAERCARAMIAEDEKARRAAAEAQTAETAA